MRSRRRYRISLYPYLIALSMLTGLLVAFNPVLSKAEENAESAVAEESTCITCHTEIDDKNRLIVEEFKRSAMFTHGIDCSDCHGGDPKDKTLGAMAPEKGFKGVPGRREIPALCASCHADSAKMLSYGSRIRTDQLDLYKQSKHGKSLFERGDTNVAVCSDCHNAHEVLSPRNPKSPVYKKNIPKTCGKCHANRALMTKYGINPNVVSDYEEGYHAYLVYNQEELAAPVCSDCHGNHSATPPGISTIDQVCSFCHPATVANFEQSAHSKVFPELGIKNCLSCHNQHKLERPTDDYFNPEAEFSCARCHPVGTDEAITISSLSKNIHRIAELKQSAEELIEETESITHLSMLEMKPKVDDINTNLLTARAKQHTLNLQLVEAESEKSEEIYSQIQQYAGGLIERSKKVRLIVIVLAGLLAGYGIFLLLYRKSVLDRIYPWQRYRG